MFLTSCLTALRLMSWSWTRASETPKRPIMIATKWIPLIKPIFPKVKRPWPVKLSMPTMLSRTPRAPAKIPLASDSPERLPTSRIPMIASSR